MRIWRYLFVLLVIFEVGGLRAEQVLISGGPTLSKFEGMRVPEDQHDRWWGNFIRAATIRMDQIRKDEGPTAAIVWIVFRPAYVTRGREDVKPYLSWISEQASKRNVTLKWVDTRDQLISAINGRGRRSITRLEYYGHSNKYAFMLDYSNDVMGACTEVLHERDLSRIKKSVFASGAWCKSYGCHTGQSMTAVWKRALGVPLEGARGKTLYTEVGIGVMPKGFGGWVH